MFRVNSSSYGILYAHYRNSTNWHLRTCYETKAEAEAYLANMNCYDPDGVDEQGNLVYRGLASGSWYKIAQIQEAVVIFNS